MSLPKKASLPLQPNEYRWAYVEAVRMLVMVEALRKTRIDLPIEMKHNLEESTRLLREIIARYERYG